MAKTLNEKLRYYMKRKGNLTEIELARAACLPQPTIHHILSGATSRPRRKSLVAIANALSITINDLFDETPLEEIREQLQPHGFSLLPLISWEDACRWPQQKRENPQAIPAKNIFTDIAVGEDAFALMMKGSSMETLFPEGALLIVDPQKEIKDKSYVVVHLENDKEALFKQVLIDGPHYYLKSLNPLLNTLGPIPLGKEDRIIGVAVQTRMNFE